MKARIEIIGEKKLVGKRIIMSMSENKTAEHWRSFMTLRKSILNSVGNDLYSLQVYPPSYFDNFNPEKTFEKWAVAEVFNFENIPENFETFTLPGGLYAVFHHIGMDTSIFHTIFTEWLPKSKYLLENRPHFEILGDKYKNGDPNSEEEIWIPIKPKN